MNDVVNNWRHRIGAGLRYSLPQGPAGDRRRLCGRLLPHHPRLATPDVQVHFIIFSADTRAPRCIRSRASSPRSASCGRRAAASCASSRPIRRRRRRSSRAISPAQLDRDTMVAGMKLLRRIMGQPAMRRYIAEERAPGPDASATRICSPMRARPARRLPSDQHLPHGADATAVVDERLRVRGIERSARGRRLDHADSRVRQHQRRRS